MIADDNEVEGVLGGIEIRRFSGDMKVDACLIVDVTPMMPMHGVRAKKRCPPLAW